MTRFFQRRHEARPAALLVVQIDCQDCALDGVTPRRPGGFERQLLGPNGRCHRCGSGSFVYVGARPSAMTVAEALASIERAESAHQNAIDALRRSCGLPVDGGAQ